MKQNYHISEFEKGQIEALKELGWSNRLIAQSMLRHHYTTDNYFKNNGKASEKRKLGPKEKLSPREKSRIFIEINRERTKITKIKVTSN